MDTISTSKLTLWRVILKRYRTVSSDVFLNAHLEWRWGSLSSMFLDFEGFEASFVRVFSISEASKHTFFDFCRVLIFWSKLSSSFVEFWGFEASFLVVVLNSGPSERAFFELSLVLRLRSKLSSSFLEFGGFERGFLWIISREPSSSWIPSP